MTHFQAAPLIFQRFNEIFPANWIADPAFKDIWEAAVEHGRRGELLIIYRSKSKAGLEWRLEWR